MIRLMPLTDSPRFLLGFAFLTHMCFFDFNSTLIDGAGELGTMNKDQ